MKRVKEEFVRKGDKIVIRRLIQEEEFKLSMEEIERMEKNANVRIEMANNELELANQKLEECKKLKDMISGKNNL